MTTTPRSTPLWTANPTPLSGPAAAGRPGEGPATAEPPVEGAGTARGTGLVREVVCPNCWDRFPPERSLFIAQHADLYGDRLLGDNARTRFLPSRFHPDGRAIDPLNSLCHETACPRCHLPVPRNLLEHPTIFLSMFGAPGSGKSYLLAAMMHTLRRLLAPSFGVSISDADPQANLPLHAYEDTLFGDSADGSLVKLEKTKLEGDPYHAVDYGDRVLLYPKPFFLQVGPVAGHPHVAESESLTRTICLYDNAGESFEPGRDVLDNPATQHLARAEALLFVFDPLQHAEVRRRLPADAGLIERQDTRATRQDVLLAEVASRVRRYHQLPAGGRHDRPLIVAVSKFDVWQSLFGGRRMPEPWRSRPGGEPVPYPRSRIEMVSGRLRELLQGLAPEIVATAESFVPPERILYLPVAAAGTNVSRSEAGGLGHVAGSLDPMWAEVPLVHVLADRLPRLIPSD